MIALQYISALIVKYLCENQMHYESKDAKSMHYLCTHTRQNRYCLHVLTPNLGSSDSIFSFSGK